MHEELIAKFEQLKRLTTSADLGSAAEIIACIESLATMADNKDYHAFFRTELEKTPSFAHDLGDGLTKLASNKSYHECAILLFSFLAKLKKAELIVELIITKADAAHLLDYSIEQLAEGKADLFLEIITADTLLGESLQPHLLSRAQAQNNLEKVFKALIKRGEADDYVTIIKVLTQTTLLSHPYPNTSVIFGFLLLQELAETRAPICNLLTKALPRLSATDSLKLFNFLINRAIEVGSTPRPTEKTSFYETLFLSYSKEVAARATVPVNPDSDAIHKYILLLKKLAESDSDFIPLIQAALESSMEGRGIVSILVKYSSENYQALFELINYNLLTAASLSEARSHLIKFFNSRSDAQLLEILGRKEAYVLDFLKANTASLPRLANASDPRVLILLIGADLLNKEGAWLVKSALATANDRFIAALGYDEKNPSREQIDSLMSLLKANKNNPREIARIKPMVQRALLVYATQLIKEKRELATVRTLIAAVLDPENDSYGKALFPFSSTAEEEKHFADFLPLLKVLNGELAETLDRARSGRAVAKFFTERAAASGGAGRLTHGDEGAASVEEFKKGIAETISIDRPGIQ